MTDNPINPGLPPTKLRRCNMDIDPTAPTEHKHGSEEKVAVMAERAALDLPLFNPGDRKEMIDPPDSGRRTSHYVRRCRLVIGNTYVREDDVL